MDAFTVVFGGTLALVILVLLPGLFSKRSARDDVDWRPTRSADVEAQNDVDDIEQMIEGRTR